MIGYQRFTIWTLLRLISLRTYHGTVSYQRAANYQHTNASVAPSPAIGPYKSATTAIGAYYGSNGSATADATSSAAHNGYGPMHPLDPATGRPQMKHSLSCGNQLDCSECNGDGDCEACDTGFGDVLTLETQLAQASPGYYRPRLDSWYSATSRKSAYYSTADSMYQSVGGDRVSNTGRGAVNVDSDGNGGGGAARRNDSFSRGPAQMYGPASGLPALTASVPANWTVERGGFIMVHATYQSHISSDCFFAPLSQLNDGLIWLCIIRAGASRQDLLKFMLGMSNGTHLAQPTRFVEMIPVTAFRIEPDMPATAAAAGAEGAEMQHGHFTVDGERVEYGPVQAEVVPGAAQVMAPIYGA